jgi:hypothetical protein
MRGMRHLLVAALLVAACTAPMAAQDWDWTLGGGPACPTCRVISYVDIVSPTMLAGWGLVCQSGQGVHRFDVYYSDASGLHRVQDAVSWFGLPRPDVREHFTSNGACPSVELGTGWHVYLPTPIPSGATFLSVVVWHGPFRQAHTFKLPLA